jgi:hypothetical protein
MHTSMPSTETIKVAMLNSGFLKDNVNPVKRSCIIIHIHKKGSPVSYRNLSREIKVDYKVLTRCNAQLLKNDASKTV